MTQLGALTQYDRPVKRTLLLYAIIVVGAALAVLAIVRFGDARFVDALTGAGSHALAPAQVQGSGVYQNLRHPLAVLIIQLVVIVLTARVFGYWATRLGQPPVVGISGWMIAGVIIVVATTGKLGGSMLAARFTGMDWSSAFMLGALMNTRGLMELVALNVGYELGVLSPRLFTMLVLMALVTTAMTGPLLQVARQRERTIDGTSWLPT